MSKLKILALDQAEKTGWCCGTDLYGEWNFKVLRDESSGMKLIRLRSKLQELHEAHNFNLIVHERTGGRFKDDIASSAKMVSVIQVFCEDNGIDFTAVSATEIKEFATGSGKSNKEEMLKAAKAKYGYTGSSDNIADAIHLFHLAQERYNK